MSEQIVNGNKQAFPIQAGKLTCFGITKRELFAKDLACSLVEANHLEQFQGRDGDEYLKAWLGQEAEFDKWIARRASEMADALLAQLERSQS